MGSGRLCRQKLECSLLATPGLFECIVHAFRRGSGVFLFPLRDQFLPEAVFVRSELVEKIVVGLHFAPAGDGCLGRESYCGIGNQTCHIQPITILFMPISLFPVPA